MTARIASPPVRVSRSCREYLGSDRIALLWAHDEFEIHDPAVQLGLQATRADLDVAGAQVDVSLRAWHFLGAAYFLQVRYSGFGAAGHGAVRRRLLAGRTIAAACPYRVRAHRT